MMCKNISRQTKSGLGEYWKLEKKVYWHFTARFGVVSVVDGILVFIEQDKYLRYCCTSNLLLLRRIFHIFDFFVAYFKFPDNNI